MKCHYDVLNVPRDAELAEIKSAYRKSALKWHPDKNLNNTDDAKEQFQLVQQAYEVLSDPQERAWYDQHREQILHGANSEFQDKSLDVFQYFTTSCFKGYGDDEKGFYTVYRNVFDQIIEEDTEFMDDKEEFSNIPRFGNSKSDYDDVVGPFYGYWQSYCTKKSYVWLDPYDIKDIPNKKIFKLAEKENKKVRMQAKKERNEEIRNLVAFVMKRDKRVQERKRQTEAKILENRQKQEELSKQRRLERKKQLNESGGQAEWAKFDNVKSELEEIERNIAEEFGDSLSEEEEEVCNDVYCVACNKVFKTAKALANHESSKKHKENVEALRTIMLEEEEEENDQEGSEDLHLEESDDSIEQTKKQKKKNKKSRNVLNADDEDPSCDIDFNNVVDSDGDFDFETKNKKRKNKKPSKSKAATQPTVEENSILKESSQKKKQSKKEEKNVNVKTMYSEDVDVGYCCVICNSSFVSKNKLFDHLKKTNHGVYLPNKMKNGK